MEYIMEDVINKVRIFSQFLVVRPNFEEKVDTSFLKKFAEEKVGEKQQKFQMELKQLEGQKDNIVKENMGDYISAAENYKKELEQLTLEEKELMKRIETIRNKKLELKGKISKCERNVIEFQKEQKNPQSTGVFTKITNQMSEIQKTIEQISEKNTHFVNIVEQLLPEAFERNQTLISSLSPSELYHKISVYCLQLLRYFKEKFESMMQEIPKLQSRFRIIVRGNFERMKLQYQTLSGSIQAILNHPSFVQDPKIKEEIQATKTWIEKADITRTTSTTKNKD